jgi:diacylglycerol O-acyltransferase / wax synthase
MSARAKRMTSLDAAFYHLEKTGQLLHVAGVYTVEGALDFERLRADIAARLHLIPRYTERVVPVPLNLAHPTWEPDPGFDIRRHVMRHQLKAPGDDAQLVSLASRLFAQPLDRSIPLWELHQIDGYHGDRTAIFAKVHHCMIDGVSGVQLLGVLFDPSPNPAPVPPPEHAAQAPPLPSPLVQLTRAIAENVSGTVANVRSLAQRVRKPSRFLAELSEAADAAGELLGVAFQSPPPTPFNGHVSTLRRVVWTTFGLNTVKAVKNRLGGTVNDVVLATISAALRRYLESKGLNPDRTELRAMLPVNLRRPDEHLHLGNRVSMLMAPLPVGIFDPLERYRQVRTATAQLKERGQASRWTRLLELVEMLPAPLQAPIGRFQLTAAPINTVCTNIPGPPVSLYVQGKRLETLAPIVPLAQGVGLAFAILSYADSLTIGITADPALVPDVDGLCGLLQDGFEELRGLAGVEVGERRGPVRPERQRRLESVPPRVA